MAPVAILHNRLGSGAVIEQQESLSRARLGLLVTDSNGRLIGLTARHALTNENGILSARISNNIIGYRLGPENRTDVPRSMIESIALIEVDAGVALDETRSALNFMPPDEMVHLMGKRVRKFGSQGEQATITSLYGTITLVPPRGGGAVAYYNTIEIEPDDPDDFGASGDAGSLILCDDPDPKPAGILMARSGARFFLAPIFELLQSCELELLTEAGAIDRNMRSLQKALIQTPSVERLLAYFESPSAAAALESLTVTRSAVHPTLLED